MDMSAAERLAEPLHNQDNEDAMEEKKLLIIVTHSADAPERACAALSIAGTALANGIDIALFFVNDGALLLKKGYAETVKNHKAFPTLPKLLGTLVDMEQKFHLCSACAKQYGMTEADFLPGTELAGAQAVIELAMEREVMTF